MSRADKITPLKSIPEYFADFSTNLERNLQTAQIERLINEEAIKQAIVNLVLTDTKERFYQPNIGSRVKESLFGLVDDPLTIENIKESVRDCIEKNEPRANVLRIDFDNNNTDLNGYYLHIHFSMINITQIFTATVFIQRVR